MNTVRSVSSGGNAVPESLVGLTAVERLAQSRQRLRQALDEMAGPPKPTQGPCDAGSEAAWLKSLKSIPGANVVIATLRHWWAQHPLHMVNLFAVDAVKTLVQPLAKRNPMQLALGAAVAGGLLVWIRPWRWIPKSVLFAGLLPQLLTNVLIQVDMRSWLNVLASLMQHRQPEAPAQTAKAEQGTATVPTRSTKGV